MRRGTDGIEILWQTPPKPEPGNKNNIVGSDATIVLMSGAGLIGRRICR